MPKRSKQSLSYASAGVSIVRGSRLVKAILPLAKETAVPGVLGGIGGFSSLFELKGYRQPILVASTDGVGTKLKLALELNSLSGIGVDCAAMVLNDLVVTGAKPLFLLDYFATSRLSVKQARIVIAGVARACKVSGCALVGGETAEMPGLYAPGDFDIAAFGVAVAEKRRLVTGQSVRSGHVVVGISSSGFHSNGYSLIRKIVRDRRLKLSRPFIPGSRKSLSKLLLEPTHLYVTMVRRLQSQGVAISAMAHNTGGGVIENLPRVIPNNIAARLNRRDFEQDPLTERIAHAGHLRPVEKLRTFNCGYGFFVIVPPEAVPAVYHAARLSGYQATSVGELVPRPRLRQSSGAPGILWA